MVNYTAIFSFSLFSNFVKQLYSFSFPLSLNLVRIIGYAICIEYDSKYLNFTLILRPKFSKPEGCVTCTFCHVNYVSNK